LNTQSDRWLADLLVEASILTADESAEALTECRETARSLSEQLTASGRVASATLHRLTAERLGWAPVDVGDVELSSELLEAVPREFALGHCLLPLSREDHSLVVAVADPFNQTALDDLRLLTGLKIKPMLGEAGAIRRRLEQFYAEAMIREIADQDLEVVAEETQDLADLQKMAGEEQVIQFVNLLIHRAINQRASDIHIEPFERQTTVRYRIDGVLRTAPAPPKRLHAAVVSRIKIMSDMDIAERRLPQDGRIALRLAGRQFDVRVSTLPTLHGETVVMRLLDQSSALFGLEELGMESVVLEQFAKVIVHPHGIILVTGPTGSGKTTTLYAALSRIFSPEKKIITIEDPVEYQLEGVNQIHVRPASGLTFASGLRHMVRQDPDIIMVGEIRDHETAEIAIHAALTGHLVFSTLHTNDAAGAVARLLEMGVEPFLAASSLIGVLAQRLVRVICPQCKTTTTVPAETLATLNVPADEAATATLYRGAGCDNCGGTGYQGRRGIFELLTVTSGVRDLIALRATASQLKQKAMGEGMRTLAVSGRDKALAGLTTVEEVLRVAVADEQLEVRS